MTTENEDTVAVYAKDGVTVYSPQEIDFLNKMKVYLTDFPLNREVYHCPSCVDGVCVGYNEGERFQGGHTGCVKNEVLLYHLLGELAESADDDYALISCIPLDDEVHITRVFETIEKVDGEVGGSHHSAALFFHYRETVSGKREFINAWLIPQDDNHGRAIYYPSRLSLATLRAILGGEA